MSYRNDKASPLGQDVPTLQEVDNIIYGGSEPPASGRVVAKPIEIGHIWPDVTQPRRVIPAVIRKRWNGDPAAIQGMIVQWQAKVRGLLRPDERLNAGPVLKGEDFIDLDREQQPRLVQAFIELIDLAANIREQGLNLPITVARDGERYLLHTGERRLVAHHLLNLVLGTHDKIAAIEREPNVWSQIAENTQRSQMNAVSMARALAKLKMDMYAGELTFEPYETTETGCDKAFYAQVVDLSIRQGMAEQVMNALNIANRSMLSRYNKILTLPDHLWIQADEEDWTEGRIRQWFEDQKPPESSQLLPIGNNSGVFSPQTPFKRDLGDGESKLRDVADTPPIRTSIGERMGLYNPHPPAPSPLHGEGESKAPRPVITYLSTDEEWQAAGYVHCPHPEEMEPGEKWDDSDEAEAAEYMAELAINEAKSGILDNTPICIDGSMELLDLLASLARAIEDRKTAQTITYIRNRGREDVRLWMLEHDRDLNGYKTKLESESNQISMLLSVVTERVWDALTYMLEVAGQVQERM
jgi:hypothetical protein